MRRSTMLLLACSVLVAGAGVGASAGRCEHDIVIFSYLQGVGAVNSNYATCTATGVSRAETGYDGRIINPGHDIISVRYLNAVKRDPEIIWAKLNGLGFSRRWVPLQRVEVADGTWVYDQLRPVALHDGSSASGCVRVTVRHVEERTKRTRSGDLKTVRKVIVNDRTAFHTIDSTC